MLAMLASLAAFTGVLASGASGAGAAPARPSAVVAYKCTPNARTFAIPSTADIRVTVNTCVRVTTSAPNGPRSVQALADVSWERGQPRVFAAFDSFKVIVRLERSDNVIQEVTCELGGVIGSSGSGLHTCGPTIAANKGSARTWTSDGYVYADINNDGVGYQPPWYLTGSPRA
jgi:hypothetical protein